MCNVLINYCLIFLEKCEARFVTIIQRTLNNINLYFCISRIELTTKIELPSSGRRYLLLICQFIQTSS